MLLPDLRIRQRDYLLEIARALTEELDLDKLLSRILRIALEMLAGQAGLIALREKPGGWRAAAADGLAVNFIRYVQPLLKQIPEKEDPETSELPAINRILQDIASLASFGLLSGVGLPLVARQQVIGVIFVFRSYPDMFSTNDRTLLRSFANQAAIAVSNAQLIKQVTDEKQRTNALLDSVADGILILSPQFEIIRCNPPFTRLVQKKAEQIIGKTHDEIIHWVRPPEGLTLEKASQDGWPLTPGATLYVEGDIFREEPNTPLPVGITYAPLMDSAGVLTNIIASTRDISRFREADELKSTFISIISHELKTPVALIKGYVSTLRREDADWDRNVVDDSLEVIEEEADRLTTLIEDLLDASRLQSGALSLKPTDVLLPDLVKQLVERFSVQTENHQITSDFPPNFPVILTDENRIRQVFNNLITNAIKYSADGEIRISGQVRPDQVIISVSDEGPGIDSTDLPHVFDRFYRSTQAVKKTKGAGLGLYLARAIIEAHRGRIWVENRPAGGAQISFSLPRHE
jgi:signal transduction histidine kinase